MKKRLKTIKKKGKDLAYLAVFKLMYLAGLTVIIPFVLSIDVPHAVGLWAGTQRALFAFSLFFIGFSFYGVYNEKRQSLSKTLRTMGFMTLIPGGISLFFAIFGKHVLPALYSLISSLPDIERLNDLINVAVENSINRVWYLTMSYIVLGLLLYHLSNRS